MGNINVTKASGEQEPFDESKLRQSLASAGAKETVIEQVVASVHNMMHDGISTKKLYRKAFQVLKQHSRRSAGRYKLKEALLQLGPTGYPFEKLTAELLSRLGYQTRNGIIVKGRCVSHEIDVIAEKNDEHYMVECKFHNRQDHTCNVKVPLYIHSRFKDVEENWCDENGKQGNFQYGWIITNTRFTDDATAYANCMGLKLLSWDYPKRSGLKDLIERVNLHPITCLSSLDKNDKKLLLNQEIVFCTQLCEDNKVLDQLNTTTRTKREIIKEAKEICNHTMENHD